MSRSMYHRLEQDHPRIWRQVRRRKLTPAQGLRKAGLLPAEVSVPIDDLAEAAKRIRRHLPTLAARQALAEELLRSAHPRRAR